MGVHIKGVRDLDGKFQQMLEVKRACERAAVGYPAAVVEYFDGAAEEDESYLRHEMEEIEIKQAVVVEDVQDSDSCLIDLSKLPPEVKKIRVLVLY